MPRNTILYFGALGFPVKEETGGVYFGASRQNTLHRYYPSRQFPEVHYFFSEARGSHGDGLLAFRAALLQTRHEHINGQEDRHQEGAGI